MPEWLNARPLSATLVVPGTERTREHPEQPAAPKLLGDADTPATSPRAESRSPAGWCLFGPGVFSIDAGETPTAPDRRTGPADLAPCRPRRR